MNTLIKALNSLKGKLKGKPKFKACKSPKNIMFLGLSSHGDEEIRTRGAFARRFIRSVSSATRPTPEMGRFELPRRY